MAYLKQIGLNKNRANECERIAAIPAPFPKRVLDPSCRSRGPALALAAMRRAAGPPRGPARAFGRRRRRGPSAVGLGASFRPSVHPAPLAHAGDRGHRDQGVKLRAGFEGLGAIARAHLDAEGLTELEDEVVVGDGSIALGDRRLELADGAVALRRAGWRSRCPAWAASGAIVRDRQGYSQGSAAGKGARAAARGRDWAEKASAEGGKVLAIVHCLTNVKIEAIPTFLPRP